jgi:hypothetical protein
MPLMLGPTTIKLSSLCRRQKSKAARHHVTLSIVASSSGGQRVGRNRFIAPLTLSRSRVFSVAIATPGRSPATSSG